jgi:hypothetical protein
VSGHFVVQSLTWETTPVPAVVLGQPQNASGTGVAVMPGVPVAFWTAVMIAELNAALIGVIEVGTF